MHVFVQFLDFDFEPHMNDAHEFASPLDLDLASSQGIDAPPSQTDDDIL